MNSRQQILEAQKREQEDAEKRQRELKAQWQESFFAECDAKIAELEAMAKEVELPLRAFVDQYILNRKRPAAKPAAKPVAESPKYISPFDATQSWSGKGPAPKWFQTACAKYVKESLLAGRVPQLLVPKHNEAAANGAAH